ncbi:MAG: hypothetical protein HC888_05395 [Candidatus Competibacteraceae bacterium]|nr:hypothetical protein [Candidatus Competibacteraceae bacterium]
MRPRNTSHPIEAKKYKSSHASLQGKYEIYNTLTGCVIGLPMDENEASRTLELLVIGWKHAVAAYNATIKNKAKVGEHTDDGNG